MGQPEAGRILPVDGNGQPLREAEVGAVWDSIKAGMAIAMDGADTRPEDVYAELRAGTASLFMNADGFVVLKVKKVVSRGRLDCVVWVMYGFGYGFLSKYQAHIVGLAKAAGASRVTFYTKRADGFEKFAPEIGFRAGFTEFILEI